jgi:hypothetical protein
MTVGRQNGSAGERARELLIDRLLPRFEARTLSVVMVDAGTEPSASWIRIRWAGGSV